MTPEVISHAKPGLDLDGAGTRRRETSRRPIMGLRAGMMKMIFSTKSCRQFDLLASRLGRVVLPA